MSDQPPYGQRFVVLGKDGNRVAVDASKVFAVAAYITADGQIAAEVTSNGGAVVIVPVTANAALQAITGQMGWEHA